MPHVVIQYTPNIDADMESLCRQLAAVLVERRDEEGKQLFPIGGTRVMAYPAAHHAVADGKQDYAFVYINVRIAPGRSAASTKAAGDALLVRTQAHFADLFARRLIGITIQIDEGPGQIYDAKHSNLHPLFNK
ncbi:MAG: 5-carboxymethyl-2-hydroxymuconate isomerase [Ramlibacter sp.]